MPTNANANDPSPQMSQAPTATPKSVGKCAGCENLAIIAPSQTMNISAADSANEMHPSLRVAHQRFALIVICMSPFRPELGQKAVARRSAGKYSVLAVRRWRCAT